MNSKHRFCTQKGHQYLAAIMLCSFKNCEVQQRWCCDLCITQEIHKHDQSDLSHIIDQEQIVIKKYELINKLKAELQIYERTNSKLQSTLQSITYLNQTASEQLVKCQLFIVKQKQLIIKEEKSLNISISELKEKRLFNFNSKTIYEMFFPKTNDPLRILKGNLSNWKFFLKNYNNDEQYVSYGDKDQMVKIYDIKNDKLKNCIKQNEKIFVCQFSVNSQYLFIGLYDGFVLGYTVYNNFKQRFRKKIHKRAVCNILVQEHNKYLITCSQDGSIRKTDINSKKLIFKLTGHNNILRTIDYSEKDDMVVSGSTDKSIKLWDCKTKRVIINEKLSDQVVQLQLIDNKQNILSLDDQHKLFKWKIDKFNNKLIKILDFSDHKNIYNFYQFNQDQNLLIMLDGYFKILDDQGETIGQFDHKIRGFGKTNIILIETYLSQCRQLENGRLIHIRTLSTKIWQVQKQIQRIY